MNQTPFTTNHFFSWMQTKLDRRQETQKPSWSSSGSVQCRPPSDTRKEEFGDWPETLLAIGTFGSNNKVKEESPGKKHDSSQAQDEDISVEEAGHELTKELTELLPYEPRTDDTSESERGTAADDDQEVEVSAEAKIVLNKVNKDLLVDNRGGVRERPLSFLLRKMFVCHSGFAPTPSLKEPPTETRAEKVLRTLLHKKIYPQSNLQPLAKKMLEKQSTSRKKFLGRRREVILWPEEEKAEIREDDHRNKWVKTDSEYIVLEI